MGNSSCRLQTLASDRWCAVDHCSECEVFHLKLGYTTLHLSAEAFSAVCTVLNAALARYQRSQRGAEVDAVSPGDKTLRH